MSFIDVSFLDSASAVGASSAAIPGDGAALRVLPTSVGDMTIPVTAERGLSAGYEFFLGKDPPPAGKDPNTERKGGAGTSPSRPPTVPDTMPGDPKNKVFQLLGR